MGQQSPLSDRAIDRELEAALAIEPSPEFEARVRLRVAAEAQPGDAVVVMGAGDIWTVERPLLEALQKRFKDSVPTQ